MESIGAFAAFTAECQAQPPEIALVLGSGLGVVAERVHRLAGIPFGAVPGMSGTTVAGHRGRITLGEWVGQRVLLCEGRLHFYEGHAWEEVVRPVRTLAALGARRLVLTNAAGGIRDDLAPGSLMALTDHLDCTRTYFWRESGTAQASLYSGPMRHGIVDAGRALGIDVRQGVYAQVTGPCYETPAEIRALRTWEADAVGMSTGREAEAAQAAGMECAALSCITNRAAGLVSTPPSHEEVMATASAQGQRLADLLERWLTDLT